jgi:hypothetical protein
MNVTQQRSRFPTSASKFHVQFGYASLRRLLYIKYTFPTSSFIIHQTRGGKKKKKKTRRVLLVVFVKVLIWPTLHSKPADGAKRIK